GHDIGDAVLKEFASRVRSTVRGADLACRYGGEEFVVVMPDTPADVAAAVAERLRIIIESVPFQIGRTGEVLAVTASLGLSTLQTGDTPEALVKRADTALYEAKRSGRNRVVAAAA
ncbi:diguanylate cyclase, partial [Rhizobium sp. TRM95111]|uniref:diguanylate cyclase n=1 Tax=Rhizobium alarense TaxID=2846851 RepID=UPI001F2D944D